MDNGSHWSKPLNLFRTRQANNRSARTDHCACRLPMENSRSKARGFSGVQPIPCCSFPTASTQSCIMICCRETPNRAGRIKLAQTIKESKFFPTNLNTQEKADVESI